MVGENFNNNTDNSNRTAWDEMAETVNRRAEVVNKSKNNKAFKRLALGLLIGAGALLMTGCGSHDANVTEQRTPDPTTLAITETVEDNSFDDGGIEYDIDEPVDKDNSKSGGSKFEKNIDDVHEDDFWDEDGVFHTDEYMRALGYEDYTTDTMIRGTKAGGGVLEVDRSAGYITLCDMDCDEVWTICCAGVDSSSEGLVDLEFLDSTATIDLDNLELRNAGLRLCATEDGVTAITNGQLPDGWVFD